MHILHGFRVQIYNFCIDPLEGVSAPLSWTLSKHKATDSPCPSSQSEQMTQTQGWKQNRIQSWGDLPRAHMGQWQN